MKRQLITVIAGAVLLAGLLCLYKFMPKLPKAADAEPPAAPSAPAYPVVALFDRDESALERVTLVNKNGEFNLTPFEEGGGISWSIEEAGEAPLPLNASLVGDTARVMKRLSMQKASENPEAGYDYGFEGAEGAEAKALFKDGEVKTLKIGRKTITGEEYYANLSGDPAVYLMNSYDGDKLFYGWNDFADKSLPSVDSQNLDYIYVGTPGAELEAAREDGELVMKKPWEGLRFNSADFSQAINFAGAQLGDLVELNAGDLGKYGFDGGYSKIILRDPERALNLAVGASDGEGNFYVKIGVNDNVFKMEEDFLAGLPRLEPFKYVDTFVAPVVIDDVSEIDFGAPSRAGTRVRLSPAEVDGKAADEAELKAWARKLADIRAEAPLPAGAAVSDEPALAVSYTTKGGEITTEYKEYEGQGGAEFYAVKIAGRGADWFVVSRETVDEILAAAPKPK
ncbi:MAG: DUF4340 domain-containing protein [Clostridiales bacterium]|jgi:hypothetical protein|nr:DUF4340 domain-containing protein [Clostridiales bacterium]